MAGVVSSSVARPRGRWWLSLLDVEALTLLVAVSVVPCCSDGWRVVSSSVARSRGRWRLSVVVVGTY